MKFSMKIEYKCTYIAYEYYELTNSDMLTLQNFEVLYDKFNMVIICM
jgi:hypothetical protein